MSKDEIVNDLRHHDSKLKTSQKGLGNKVVEKMAPPWLNCSVPPNRGEEVVQKRTFIVVRERVRFILTSNSTSSFLPLHVKSLRRTHTIAKNTYKNQRLIQGERPVTHDTSEAESWQ